MSTFCNGTVVSMGFEQEHIEGKRNGKAIQSLKVIEFGKNVYLMTREEFETYLKELK